MTLKKNNPRVIHIAQIDQMDQYPPTLTFYQVAPGARQQAEMLFGDLDTDAEKVLSRAATGNRRGKARDSTDRSVQQKDNKSQTAKIAAVSTTPLQMQFVKDRAAAHQQMAAYKRAAKAAAGKPKGKKKRK
jgi:hypothetical protein